MLSLPFLAAIASVGGGAGLGRLGFDGGLLALAVEFGLSGSSGGGGSGVIDQRLDQLVFTHRVPTGHLLPLSHHSQVFDRTNPELCWGYHGTCLWVAERVHLRAARRLTTG